MISATPNRLLPLDAFAPIFAHLQGLRVGLVSPIGNVGDRLIEEATRQLLDAFHIQWQSWSPSDAVTPDFDEILFGGGGNMGTRYRNNWELRNAVFSVGLPVTILPQSFTSPEERVYRRVFVREQASLAYCPEGELAPDLGLGLDVGRFPGPTKELGVFLRRDPERVGRVSWFRRDPARICTSPRQYLQLASRYRRIVTDRLHFAICGLHLRREVVLVANDYHKNHSMYVTWLRDLGCRFSTHPLRAVLSQIGSRSAA
ncbi:MAG: polysaccharide pyruvyl transferase family protein [Planctomycetales bacterium]|nr:polysaccharide pyruvyl transferase family protein [Planctomycetales bacterium]